MFGVLQSSGVVCSTLSLLVLDSVNNFWTSRISQLTCRGLCILLASAGFPTRGRRCGVIGWARRPDIGTVVVWS